MTSITSTLYKNNQVLMSFIKFLTMGLMNCTCSVMIVKFKTVLLLNLKGATSRYFELLLCYCFSLGR